MAVESPINTIADLNPSWPSENEPGAQGDNHLRLIKDAIKKTWPNVNAPVTVTDTQLNMLLAEGLTKQALERLVNITATAAELNKLDGTVVTKADLTKLGQVTASATELNKLAGIGTILTEANYKNYSDYKATTLGGQDSAFHRNADNINAGTLPPARLGMSTKAEAEEATSIIKVMNPQRTKDSVTKHAPAALGAVPAGEPFSLAFARHVTKGVSISFGELFNGSALRTAGVGLLDAGDGNLIASTEGGVQLVGQWRSLGSCGGDSRRYSSTLFIRIS